MKAFSSVFLVAIFLWVPLVHGEPYVFPIVPGTPEWVALSLEERIAVQQIPEEFLETMST